LHVFVSKISQLFQVTKSQKDNEKPARAVNLHLFCTLQCGDWSTVQFSDIFKSGFRFRGQICKKRLARAEIQYSPSIYHASTAQKL